MKMLFTVYVEQRFLSMKNTESKSFLLLRTNYSLSLYYSDSCLVVDKLYSGLTVQIFCLLIQQLKKSRDPKWGEEFTFTLEEPPMKERMHVEVCSTSSRIGLLHPKVSQAPFSLDMELPF